MQRAVILAPAKLNLTLDILGRRPDGYHTVDMLMQTVDLCDRVTVERVEAPGITLRLPGSDLPADAHNTAYKAAAAFLRRRDWRRRACGSRSKSGFRCRLVWPAAVPTRQVCWRR